MAHTVLRESTAALCSVVVDWLGKRGSSEVAPLSLRGGDRA
jgi:hypothetical protein